MDFEQPSKTNSILWRVIAWIIVLAAIFGAYLIFPTWFQSLGRMLGFHK